MVQNNEVEEAMKVLGGIVSNEGILDRWRLTRR
jgi:ribosomal protein S21